MTFRASCTAGAILAAGSIIALSCNSAHAGVLNIYSIVLEGDPVAGVGSIQGGFSASEALAVNDFAVWRVESDTNNADTEADGVVLTGTRGGAASLYLREGQPLDPLDTTLDSFDSITINNSGNGGHNFFLNGTTGIFDDSGIYFNDDLVIQEGENSTSAEFSPHTPYIGFFEVKINNNDQLLVIASIDDPAIASTVDRALVRIDDPLGAATETVIAKEGDELIPGRFVTDFETSNPHIIAFNDNGQAAYQADMTGSTTDDGVIFLGDGTVNTILTREGDPSAVKGRNWGTLLGVAIDINNGQDKAYWAMRGDLDGATTDDSLILVNGVGIIAREGSGLPASGAFTFTSFGTGAVAIDDDGDVFWYGDWNDPDTTQDTGLFRNDELIVQKGVTMVDGLVLTGISAVQDNFAVSDSGEWLVFEGTLSGGLDGAFLVEVPNPCPADINGDKLVDINDLFSLIAVYGTNDPDGDVDNEGDVDIDDLFTLLAAWGMCS